MEHKETVGRFAPTPSGRMHLGNLLCSLLAWLSAKSKGGSIVLRIEDLDAQRSPLAYAFQMEDDLRWMGLLWDEGGVEKDEGRYCQRNRSDIYLRYQEILKEKGLLYPCFCSRAELHAAEAPHRSDGRFLYLGPPGAHA